MCNGWVDKRLISDTHIALSCRHCRGRWVFPNTVKTWEELREYCDTQDRLRQERFVRDLADGPYGGFGA